MFSGIQQYLFENGRIDNIFTDFFYERFTDCLNEILSSYEVSLNAQGAIVYIRRSVVKVLNVCENCFRFL